MADWTKYADARLDYTFDWSAWLGSDTISSATVTADVGLTVESTTNDNTTVTAWISGGTVGQVYKIACKVTTAAGRVDERTATLLVTQ